MKSKDIQVAGDPKTPAQRLAAELRAIRDDSKDADIFLDRIKHLAAEGGLQGDISKQEVQRLCVSLLDDRTRAEPEFEDLRREILKLDVNETMKTR